MEEDDDGDCGDGNVVGKSSELIRNIYCKWQRNGWYLVLHRDPVGECEYVERCHDVR